ncbi:MAG TPA: hypothetical protein VNF49_10900 [Candidatus Binataceae bacterium]|nr:hypothetical protein [Candidatus Binataceae bacterium]
MSFRDQRASSYLRVQVRASLWTRGKPLGGWLGRLADSISSSDARKARRHVRRWLRANGLTIVLVFAMMAFAWMIVER